MYRNSRSSNQRLIILPLILLAGAALACSGLQSEPDPSPLPPASSTPATAQDTIPTAIEQPSAPENGGAGWATFEDQNLGLRFEYPLDWFGPEVNRYEGGLGVEVGSDTVYPYGTGLDERNYTVSDAYFVSVTYNENVAGWDWQEFVETQPWLETYLRLQDMEDGASHSTARSLTIRVGEVQVGDFSGIEYISTLSETAQTMIYYARETLLFDGELNYLRITGSPNNVSIGEDEDWRTAYERVDAEHNDSLNHIVESISIAGH